MKTFCRRYTIRDTFDGSSLKCLNRKGQIEHLISDIDSLVIIALSRLIRAIPLFHAKKKKKKKERKKERTFARLISTNID